MGTVLTFGHVNLSTCFNFEFISADDMSAQNTNEEVPIAGINSILPKEHGNKFYTLQILQHLDKDVCAIVSWDSSLHDSQALNRVTEGKATHVEPFVAFR